MADISMCQNGECLKSNNCYRFLAIPSLRQSYADFDLKKDRCFMPIPKYLRKEYKEG